MEIRKKNNFAGVTTSKQNSSRRLCTYTDMRLNHTVGFLRFLIKIRYRITMSSLMKYAEGFKDLPLDSAELVTDCRIASFHLGSKKFNSVLCGIFLSRISFSNSINQKKIRLAYILELPRWLIPPYMASRSVCGVW